MNCQLWIKNNKIARYLSIVLLINSTIVLPHTLAQTVQSQSQPINAASASRTQSMSSQPNTPHAMPLPIVSKPLELSLADAVQLALESNRDIKNSKLDRLIQRQDLRVAESKFKPKINPLFSVGINQNLSSSSENFSSSAGQSSSVQPTLEPIAIGISPTPSNADVNANSSRSNQSANRTQWNREVQVSGTVLTPIGTQIALTLDPIADQKLNFSITQPLLRGAGLKVNQASVQIAQLGDRSNTLAFQQVLIDKVTETITAYRTVIKAQESLRIQGLAIAGKRRQLEITQALVQAGRRPRADLVDAEKTVADSDRALVVEGNNLAQAVSNLLRLIEADQTLQLVIPQREIDALVQTDLPQLTRSPTELLQLAYQLRVDYLQTQLDLEAERLNGIVAQNNQRWTLDLKGNTVLGSQSNASGSLVLTRAFGDTSLNAELEKHRLRLEKAGNRVEQLRATVQQDVNDRLRDLTSNLNQVAAAQRAREFAEQQFKIAQERWKRRGSQTTLFEIIQKQDDLVAAQNNELSAKIDYLNAMTALEKSVGITLQIWRTELPPVP
ncbi:TolC family protein [Alkalinema sp. FACHB-956]|uniref:TolC family protein n=1 Tax=Alkalinema sp. FACHB-956 TaxID=2692768 RepID=UPI0016873EB8|nr:TolC family protein [Alkalinema sp. FACHB-956]MBD2330147.1 TolC family protein [Alkalinema sp. FACHB-956]